MTGGNIDSAEVGQRGADRPQRRLGDAVKEIADQGDDVIVGIDDVKGHEPGEDASAIKIQM